MITMARQNILTVSLICSSDLVGVVRIHSVCVLNKGEYIQPFNQYSNNMSASTSYKRHYFYPTLLRWRISKQSTKGSFLEAQLWDPKFEGYVDEAVRLMIGELILSENKFP